MGCGLCSAFVIREIEQPGTVTPAFACQLMLISSTQMLSDVEMQFVKIEMV